MRRLLLASLVFSLAGSAFGACPEDPDAMNRKGRDFAAKERWADAEKTFASLAECRPTPTAFLSLAITQLELGKLVAARKSAEKARTLAVAAKQPLAAFDDKLKEIDAALPRVVLRLQSGLRDVHPRVDGVEVGLVNGTEILVDPGEHKLVVRVEGKPPFETKIVVAKGSVIDVRVDFGEDGPGGKSRVEGGQTPSPPAPTNARAGRNYGPVTLGVLGAVVVVGAAYYGLQEEKKIPKSSGTTEEEGMAAERNRNWAIVAGIAGGVAVAGAVVWWAATPTTQVAVVPSPAGGGLVQWRGRFLRRSVEIRQTIVTCSGTTSLVPRAVRRASRPLLALALVSLAWSCASRDPDVTTSGGGDGGTGAAGFAGASGKAVGGGASGGEDCRNGVDDDGDTLVDCADPDCGQFVCVPPPPPGWQGPVAAYLGPVGAAPKCAGDDYGSLVLSGGTGVQCGTHACSPCSCGAPTGLGCDAATLVVSNGPTTDLCANALSQLALPAGACVPVQIGWFAIPAETTDGGSCAPAGGSVSKGAVSLDPAAVVCGSSALFQGGCAQGSLCAPRPASPFSASTCIAHDGDVACPAAGYTVKHVVFENIADTRACLPCTCKTPPSVSCGGSVKLYSNGSCTGAGSVLSPPVKCQGLQLAGVHAQYSPAPSTQCSPTGGGATGTCAAKDPATVCCLPTP